MIGQMSVNFIFARSLHVDSPPQIPSLTTSYVHGTSSYSLLPLTVSQSLEATVQRYPDREAVVFQQDGIRKTFAEFQKDVCFKFNVLLVFTILHVFTHKQASKQNKKIIGLTQFK